MQRAHTSGTGYGLNSCNLLLEKRETAESLITVNIYIKVIKSTFTLEEAVEHSLRFIE